MRRETLFVLGLAPLAASAEFPDWAALADVEVIEVVTVDADGDILTLAPVP